MTSTSKYYINKEVHLILQRIIHIKQLYTVLKNIKPNKKFPYIHMKLNYTMSLIESALIEKVIIELCSIAIDKNDDDLCILGFIRKYEENKEKFKRKKCIYIEEVDTNKKHRFNLNDNNSLEEEFNKLKQLLDDNSKITDFLKKYRNKQLVHNDKKQFFHKNIIYPELKVKVTYDELESFINGLFKHINNIYFMLTAIQYADNELGLEEIKYLNTLLCEDHRRKNTKTTIK